MFVIFSDGGLYFIWTNHSHPFTHYKTWTLPHHHLHSVNSGKWLCHFSICVSVCSLLTASRRSFSQSDSSWNWLVEFIDTKAATSPVSLGSKWKSTSKTEHVMKHMKTLVKWNQSGTVQVGLTATKICSSKMERFREKNKNYYITENLPYIEARHCC